MRKVLIANRGEIAVRIARACRDAGLGSVAVYAEPDRDAPHVRLADEAYALPGATAAAYLDIEQVLQVARRSGADAVHPGYGFLAENADFARAVRAAGLTWIGPPPEAIDAVGDKVSARRVARRVGAPVVPGTEHAVADAEEVSQFARTHGLPVAIKAAFGGGGRGLRVVRDLADIAEAYASATREAVAAFGRPECFVERYLDRPRHVETQCLADRYGTVVVLSTRDCTVQRRHQKLVEEAPAPFLRPEQEAELVAASKAILGEVGYVGAGTCEFLIGADGTLAFLEVNTRLQVEHPVTEEVTGIDLVREQLRVAAGEPIGYADPPVRGHSIEFRINGEDPARGFLPTPGTITGWRPPSGPGVRLDSGVETGSVLGGAFDSMLAKLIVTGADRPQALARAQRALAEFEITGLPTVLPFHQELVADPDFAPADPAEPFRVHTRWIETDLAARTPPEPAGADPAGCAPAGQGEPERLTLTVEVDRRRVEVSLPAGFASASAGPAAPARRPAARLPGGRRPAGIRPSGDGATLTSPMQGTVVRVAVGDGDRVEPGQLVVMLEAMKMEQPVLAHRAGTVRELRATVGATLPAGAGICDVID
jgi:acetyl-CoA/propionyl-CoA carboxylase biotin carboxyl carrier protein